MLFLVRGDFLDPGSSVPPDQAIAMVEQLVVPSFQIMAQQDNIKGGIFAGERAGAFIVEAASPEELDGMMNRLPFFGVVKWDIKVLVPIATMAQQLPQYIADARTMMQQGNQ
jgi:hypothetical protein